LNPLLYVTGAGAVATLNAYGSMLIGTIQTGAGATSNVNLMHGTTWNLTGPSNVTNLSVTNSIIVFAPPGSGSGFKTLTVTNYVGSGANIVMNASLGGSNSIRLLEDISQQPRRINGRPAREITPVMNRYY
jgi:autochaperone domain-containing protein